MLQVLKCGRTGEGLARQRVGETHCALERKLKRTPVVNVVEKDTCGYGYVSFVFLGRKRKKKERKKERRRRLFLHSVWS